MSSVDTPSPTAATTTAEGSIERNDDPTLNAVDQLLQQLQSHDTAVVDHENPFHEWADSDWSVLKSNAHAFARSIQTAEAELNQRHQPDHTNITSPSAAATHAFEQWANRIAHLHILDVDDELRDDPTQSPRRPDVVSPESAATLALSLTSQAPEAQLLRFKILLAQEEARTVDLEDRVSRLTHELARSRQENLDLQRTNDTLKAHNLQQLASSNGCTNGCGIARVENESLKAQNAALKQNLLLCEQQMQQLIANVEASSQRQPITAAAVEPVSNIPDHSAEADCPLSVAVSTPTVQPTASSPIAPSSDTAADLSASALTLLRVRCALTLARFTLRHQTELDHLMHFKLNYLSLQTNYDDLENSLDIERELLACEKEEHARTKAQVEPLRQEVMALHEVTANLAQQLQKYVGGQGLGMSLHMPSMKTDNAHDSASPTNAISPSYNTPARKGVNSDKPVHSTPSVLIGPTTPQTASGLAPSHPTTTNGSSGGGGGGWGLGLGWILGGSSSSNQPKQNKQPSNAAADEARRITQTQQQQTPSKR